jgi:hypothetical protein
MTYGSFDATQQACAKAITPGNYVERCFIVLNEMKKFDVEANVHFYNLILQTCANEHDEENALKIFQRKYLNNLFPNLESDTMTHYYAIRYYFNLRRFFSLRREFESDTFKIDTVLSTIPNLFIYVVTRQYHTAAILLPYVTATLVLTELMFLGIRDEHLRPDQSTFSSMMLLYESDDQRQRDFDEEKMLLYWKFMTSVGLKPGAYNT